MKLLIITQRVDILDNNLGFFHNWIEKLSQKIDKVFVICLWEGEHKLPENAAVLSLGKEAGVSKMGQFLRMQKYLLKTLPEVDGVFIHMCPIYAITSFFLAKIFRKKTVMWYAHVKGGKLAEISGRLVDAVFTPSRESFRKSGKKIIVTGHGIDVDFFKPSEKRDNSSGEKTIITIGRIAPVKDLKTLIEAMDIIVNQKRLKNIKLKIIGAAAEGYEKDYAEEIKNLTEKKKLNRSVEFSGGVPNRETVKFYQNSDLFVNMQSGGSVDKAVLEAMACGLPVILCTKIFNESFGSFKTDVIFQEKNAVDLAEKIEKFINFPDNKRKEFSLLLRDIVVESHNLNNLINKITGFFS